MIEPVGFAQLGPRRRGRGSRDSAAHWGVGGAYYPCALVPPPTYNPAPPIPENLMSDAATLDPPAQEDENPTGEALLRGLLQTLQSEACDDIPGVWARMQDPDVMDALAAGWLEDEATIQTLLAALETVPRCTTRTRALRSAVQRLATSQRRRRSTQMVDDLEDMMDRLVTVSDSLANGCPPANLVDPALLDQLRIPRGYQMDNSGVYRLATAADGEVVRHRVASAPIFVAARSVSIDTGEAKRQVMWRGASGWCSRVTDRRTILDVRRIMDLASLEAPVNSTISAQLVGFMADYEAENAHRLPAFCTADHMGWLPDDGFLLPDSHYQGSDTESRYTLSHVEGLNALAQGWKTGGSWEGWLEAAEIVRDYPYMLIAIYASVTAPLLHIIGIPGFVVDFAGETSGGKTTALRMAASVWGKPADTYPTAMYSWDATKVWIERTAGALHSLPLILDETKRAKHPRVVRDVIYDFCQGQGRGRGSLDGTRQTATWRSILISSGEGAATSFSEDAGTRARVLTLAGKPLGKDAAVGGKASEELQHIVAENHGWLGRAFVQYLTANRAQWDTIRDVYKKVREHYVEAACTAVARRHAAHLAVLEVTAQILQKVGMPEPNVNPFDTLHEAMIKAAMDANRPLAALEDVVTWCTMHQKEFWMRHAMYDDGEPKVPNGGWLGSWSNWESWEYISICSVTLRKLLSDLGHHPEEIIHRWGSRDWIMKNSKGGTTKTIRLDGAPTRCICILRAAIDEAMPYDEV